MRKSMSLVAAAALTVAGFSFNVHAADDSATTPGASGSNSAASNSGSSISVANRLALPERESQAIRHTLATVTNDALARDGYTNIARHIQMNPDSSTASNGANLPAAQPRYPEGAKPNQPAGGYTSDMATPTFKNHDDLNAAVDQFQKDWKEKYGSDFKALTRDQEAMVYNDSFQIVRNDLGSAAREASDRVSPSNSSRTNADPSSTADRAASSDRASSSDKASTDANRTASDNVASPSPVMATVILAQSGNAPAMSLDLVKTQTPGEGWKISEPASADDEVVHAALLKQLNTLHDERANWPADKDAGYRAVSQHVLAALVDANPTGSTSNKSHTVTPGNLDNNSNSPSGSNNTGTNNNGSNSSGSGSNSGGTNMPR